LDFNGVGLAVFTLGEAFGEGLTVGAGVGVAFEFEFPAVLDPLFSFEFELDEPDDGDDFLLPLFLFPAVLDDSLGVPFDLSLDPAFEAPDLFEFADDAAPRLLGFELRFVSGVAGRLTSRDRFAATAGVPPPGTLTTTSSLFARCSTWAVAPGCSLNERTVLSPAR